MPELKTLAEGKHLGLYQKGPWEFAARPHVSAVVGILPVTARGDIVLIDSAIMASLWVAEARGLI